jgi:hypothetical protein
MKGVNEQSLYVNRQFQCNGENQAGSKFQAIHNGLCVELVGSLDTQWLAFLLLSFLGLLSIPATIFIDKTLCHESEYFEGPKATNTKAIQVMAKNVKSDSEVALPKRNTGEKGKVILPAEVMKTDKELSSIVVQQMKGRIASMMPRPVVGIEGTLTKDATRQPTFENRHVDILEDDPVDPFISETLDLERKQKFTDLEESMKQKALKFKIINDEDNEGGLNENELIPEASSPVESESKNLNHTASISKDKGKLRFSGSTKASGQSAEVTDSGKEDKQDKAPKKKSTKASHRSAEVGEEYKRAKVTKRLSEKPKSISKAESTKINHKSSVGNEMEICSNISSKSTSAQEGAFNSNSTSGNLEATVTIPIETKEETVAKVYKLDCIIPSTDSNVNAPSAILIPIETKEDTVPKVDNVDRIIPATDSNFNVLPEVIIPIETNHDTVAKVDNVDRIIPSTDSNVNAPSAILIPIETKEDTVPKVDNVDRIIPATDSNFNVLPEVIIPIETNHDTVAKVDNVDRIIPTPDSNFNAITAITIPTETKYQNPEVFSSNVDTVVSPIQGSELSTPNPDASVAKRMLSNAALLPKMNPFDELNSKLRARKVEIASQGGASKFELLEKSLQNNLDKYKLVDGLSAQVAEPLMMSPSIKPPEIEVIKPVVIIQTVKVRPTTSIPTVIPGPPPRTGRSHSICAASVKPSVPNPKESISPKKNDESPSSTPDPK